MPQAIMSRTLWISILIGIAIVLFWLATEAALSLRDATMQRVILPQNADMNIKKDGSVDITTDEGTMSTGTSMPKDWPTDIPRYPDAAITYSATMNPVDTASVRMALVLATTDPRTDVQSFYEGALKNNGWTITNTMQGGQTVIMTAEKGERMLSLSIAESDGQTSITLGIDSNAE